MYYTGDLDTSGSSFHAANGIRAGMNRVIYRYQYSGASASGTDASVSPVSRNVIVCFYAREARVHDRAGRELGRLTSTTVGDQCLFTSDDRAVIGSTGTSNTLRIYNNDLSTLLATYNRGSSISSPQRLRRGAVDLWYAGGVNGVTTDCLQRITSGGSKVWGLTNEAVRSYFGGDTGQYNYGGSVMALDPSGNAYLNIWDYYNSPTYDGVTKVSSGGTIISSHLLPENLSITDLCIASDGTVYIVGVDSDAGMRYIGKFTNSISLITSNPFTTQYVYGVALDPNEDYLYCATNQRTWRFDRDLNLDKMCHYANYVYAANRLSFEHDWIVGDPTPHV